MLLRGFVLARFGPDYNKYLESHGKSTASATQKAKTRASTSKSTNIAMKRERPKGHSSAGSGSDIDMDRGSDESDSENLPLSINMQMVQLEAPDFDKNYNFSEYDHDDFETEEVDEDENDEDFDDDHIISPIIKSETGKAGYSSRKGKSPKQSATKNAKAKRSKTDGGPNKPSRRIRDRSVRTLGSLKCQWCGDVFISSAAKTRHIRKVHHEILILTQEDHIPHCCPHCNLKAPRLDTLEAHVKLVHNTALPEPDPLSSLTEEDTNVA